MSAITPAASVLLARGPGSHEAFIVRRADSLRFFGGFLAFPGGKVASQDSEVEVCASTAGPEAGAPPCERLVAAARELFEETGVLVARRPDGSFLPSSAALEQLRREMADADLPFQQVLVRLGVRLHGSDWTLIGSVTTPAFTNVRFDTTFFVAHLPPGQQAEVWPGELDHGFWSPAADLLTQWTQGECLASPPSVMILEAIRDRAVDEAPRRLGPKFNSLAAGALHPIYFAPAVQLLPLHTQSLPPSTHTNAYLVGRGPVYLLDPGSADPAELQRLFAVLDAHRESGLELTALVLTHHHPDHIGGVHACVDRYQLPVYAHPLTARALHGKIRVDREILDGDCLDLGEAPDGRGTWHLEALHTPGHAPGHLAFYEARYRLLLAGDMVSTLSSIVIAPPDGDLTVYLASLERLRGYDCRLLLPAHGSASARPRQTIDECIAHRVKREEQLLAALGATPRTVPDLAQELYRGLPEALVRFAELQLRAGLTKLQREGRIQPIGDGEGQGWCVRS